MQADRVEGLTRTKRRETGERNPVKCRRSRECNSVMEKEGGGGLCHGFVIKLSEQRSERGEEARGVKDRE